LRGLAARASHGRGAGSGTRGDAVAARDPYERTARLAPAYLVFAPAVVFVVALALGTSEWWSKLGGALVACGGPVFAAEWGRSAGRRQQAQLFQQWGGAPTVRLLRFADGGSSAVVEQRHHAVERATGITLPSADDERADPRSADDVYEAAVTALRELTRDPSSFPLVLKENTAYGFRRNLWGRKVYGIAVSALVLLGSAALLVAAALGHELTDWIGAAIAAAFAAAALLIWQMAITPAWVREAADAYAVRLVESALRVPPSRE
jgi:hypothetical protein